MTELRILLLEDSPLDAELIRTILLQGDITCDLIHVQTRTEYVNEITNRHYDLILADYSLPDFDGISALEIAHQGCPDVPFIFVSATLGEELAIEALKQGATDYVLKQRLNRLVPSVQRALRESQERQARLTAQRDRQQAEQERDRFFKAFENTNLTFQTLIESCPLAIALIDPQGVVKVWNQAAEAISGWSADETIGQFLPTVPHCREEFLTCLQTILSGTPLVGFEARHRHKSGRIVYLDVWATLTFDADGNPGCLCIAADTTERKRSETEHRQAEVALRQSEARFKRLVQSNLIGCIFWDTTGNILDANDAFLQMVGYSRAELQQGLLRWKDMTPVEYLPVSDRSIAQMRTTGEADTLEKEYICKDGSRVPVLLGGVMFENSTEQGVSFVIDLRERKKTEQTLQEQNQHLKLLFEATSDLLSTEQPLTLLNSLFKKLSEQLEIHCFFNFLVCQQGDRSVLRLESYSGISEEMAEKMQWLEFGEYACGVVAQTQQQLVLSQVQQSTQPETEVIRALGVTAYIGQPLIARGRLLGTLSFASTTRNHFTSEEVALLQATSEQVAIALERAALMTSLQQQTEQLTQANRIKDEFLAVLSHELRTPLNPILGWSRILQSRQCDAATLNRALETIERNARIQTQLIDDLLDVSRILRGKLILNTRPVNLVQPIEAALETMRLAAEAKSIQLQFLTASQNAPILVLGDSARLQQVIWNLLSNAVKFTPADGRIQVHLSVITEEDKAFPGNGGSLPMSRTFSPIEYAQLQVTDTGKGISPDFLPYIFDYFRQADGSTTRIFGGLGLGLAIAKHIIQAHGGSLQASSAGEGQGATFTLRLPLLRQSKASQPPTAAAAVPTPNLSLFQDLRALVVDDEPDTLEMIAFLLRQRGATVTTVTSVDAALNAFEQFQPDILISDIGMPEEDGYSLIRKIRERSATAQNSTPAIALTAYARDEDRRQALAAGFQRHLAKPIDPSDLISTVAEVSGRHE